MVLYSRYVALGDSFTEGIGDPHPSSRNGLRGWADRVAAHLAQRSPDFRYANLAVRGRTMNDVLVDQIEAAVMLEPDLITIYAGMNDLLMLRADLDAMMARYAEGLKVLRQTGASVMTFTAADVGSVPLFRHLRGRAAIYNELLRSVTDELGVHLIDFWRFTEYRDPRMWDSDRIHLSPLGHEHMAARALDALGIPHELATASADLLASPGPALNLRANLYWAAAFAAPWVVRRVRCLTPGEGVEPKSWTLNEVI